jgi:hypothetical protein
MHKVLRNTPSLADAIERNSSVMPSEVAECLRRANFVVWRDIIALFLRWKTGPPALTRLETRTAGRWHYNTQINKEHRGVLVAFRDGAKVLITATSFYTHLIELLIAAHPAENPDVVDVEAMERAWLRWTSDFRAIGTDGRISVPDP